MSFKQMHWIAERDRRSRYLAWAINAVRTYHDIATENLFKDYGNREEIVRIDGSVNFNIEIRHDKHGRSAGCDGIDSNGTRYEFKSTKIEAEDGWYKITPGKVIGVWNWPDGITRVNGAHVHLYSFCDDFLLHAVFTLVICTEGGRERHLAMLNGKIAKFTNRKSKSTTTTAKVTVKDLLTVLHDDDFLVWINGVPVNIDKATLRERLPHGIYIRPGRHDIFYDTVPKQRAPKRKRE